MKRLFAAGCMLAVMIATRGGAALSVAAGHHGGAVRRRRADRRARAHRGAAHVGSARPDRAGGKRHRRVRHGRGLARGALRARWLHVHSRQLAGVRGRQHDHHDFLRRARRLRADRADAEQPLHRGEQERPSGEGPQGAGRVPEGQSRQGVGRDRRRRHRAACERCLLPEGDRHGLHLRALPRGLLERDARSRRRPHRSHIRPGDQRAAVRAQRAGARLCGHRQDAAFVRARHPDGGRGRCARRLYLDLVRPVGAEGHAGRGDREAQRRGAGSARRSRGGEAAHRSGPGNPAPDQQTPAALSALLKAEMEKWGPIIKGAGIKAE